MQNIQKDHSVLLAYMEISRNIIEYKGIKTFFYSCKYISASFVYRKSYLNSTKRRFSPDQISNELVASINKKKTSLCLTLMGPYHMCVKWHASLIMKCFYILQESGMQNAIHQRLLDFHQRNSLEIEVCFLIINKNTCRRCALQFLSGWLTFWVSM